MNHTFNLDDKFCDADDPKHSWYQTKIPGEIVEFFSTLFKIAKMWKLRHYYENDDDLGNSDAADNNYDSIPFEIAKIRSIFQILYYNVNNDRRKTPLNLMNEIEIYEKCKSRELITSFNQMYKS